MNHSRATLFGPEYEQLLLAAFASPPLRFPFATPGKAKSFRTKFYSYMRALREENLRLDLIEMADALSIIEEGSTLIIQLKTESWEAIAIRQQLGLAKDFAANGKGDGNELRSSPDLLQNRLMAKLSEVRARKAGGSTIVRPLNTGK